MLIIYLLLYSQYLVSYIKIRYIEVSNAFICVLCAFDKLQMTIGLVGISFIKFWRRKE